MTLLPIRSQGGVESLRCAQTLGRDFRKSPPRKDGEGDKDSRRGDKVKIGDADFYDLRATQNGI